MSRSAKAGEDFYTVWNQFRVPRRLRNYEIASEMGVSEHRIIDWNVGREEPQGEYRRKLVVWVGRYDRVQAERFAHILGLEREIGLLLDGAVAHIDASTMMGDVYMVSNELRVAPRVVKLAVQSLMHHWGRRGWSMAQLVETLMRVPDAADAPPSDAATPPKSDPAG